MTNKVAIISTAIALISAQVASASSICWSNDAVSAAKIVDFEIMLQMASNRCILERPLLKNQYAKFNKLTSYHFSEANKILDEHFQRSDFQTQITINYTEFVLSTKKNYLNDVNNLECNEFSRLTDVKKLESFSKQNLLDLSNMAGNVPTVVGKRCANRVGLTKSGDARQELNTN
jgi:hypothetical protein